MQQQDKEWWRKLAAVTSAAQHADGLWASETAIMREDDPLISTPLALETLLLCRGMLAQ